MVACTPIVSSLTAELGWLCSLVSTGNSDLSPSSPPSFFISLTFLRGFYHSDFHLMSSTTGTGQ